MVIGEREKRGGDVAIGEGNAVTSERRMLIFSIKGGWHHYFLECEILNLINENFIFGKTALILCAFLIVDSN